MPEVLCVECDDIPARLKCVQCQDLFCDLCFQYTHKRGNRAKHEVEKLELDTTDMYNRDPNNVNTTTENVEGTTQYFQSLLQEKEKNNETKETEGEQENKTKDNTTKMNHDEEMDIESENEDICDDAYLDYNQKQFIDRCLYIPLSLTAEERALLRIVEGVLEISEYTDKVDVSSSMYGNTFGFSMYNRFSDKKESIMKDELNDACSLASGLFVSRDLRKARNLFLNKSIDESENFYRNLFEIGRRHKILSPEKMRNTYGKLMFMMQDAITRNGVCDFDIHAPIQTVAALLEEKGSLELLKEKDLQIATLVYHSDMQQSLMEFKCKRENAKNNLYIKYKQFFETEQQLDRIIGSISDANSFIVSNRMPVDKMIKNLQKYFDPDQETSETSLRIDGRVEGSCLSHSHKTQFNFVLQSLQLWREIQDQMYKLWCMTDADLLQSSYRLTNTGQGFNRVQAAPHVSRAMAEILSTVKSRLRKSWVGLSVVHLGDRDVPNALFFIDKYTQVPRILIPIIHCVERLADLEDSNICKKLLEKYGGVEGARIAILRDFFRHGFDGSGDDGGSCVDGRLTSAWNWCSKIEKKNYFPFFLLTGFIGFDGDGFK